MGYEGSAVVVLILSRLKIPYSRDYNLRGSKALGYLGEGGGLKDKI